MPARDEREEEPQRGSCESEIRRRTRLRVGQPAFGATCVGAGGRGRRGDCRPRGRRAGRRPGGTRCRRVRGLHGRAARDRRREDHRRSGGGRPAGARGVRGDADPVRPGCRVRRGIDRLRPMARRGDEAGRTGDPAHGLECGAGRPGQCVVQGSGCRHPVLLRAFLCRPALGGRSRCVAHLGHASGAVPGGRRGRPAGGNTISSGEER